MAKMDYDLHLFFIMLPNRIMIIITIIIVVKVIVTQQRPSWGPEIERPNTSVLLVTNQRECARYKNKGIAIP